MKKQLFFLLLFSIFLTHFVEAQDTEDDTPIKVDTLLLTMPFTVSDKSGRNVPGLKKDDFTIFQNGREQDIEFLYNEEAPMSVAILIDTSGSTKEVLDKIQKSAREFIKIFRAEDKGVIVGFDYRTTFLSDLTSDKKTLSKAIEKAEIADRSGSDMNAAIMQVLNNHFASFKGRKAIIVLTDGMVVKQNISTQQVLDALQKTDTLFYPIIFKTKFYSEAVANAAANKRKPVPMELLEILSQETAGRFYEKDAANLREAFQSIAEELKNQYLLGFYPRNTDPKKSASDIKIEVDREGWLVRTKKRWSFKKTE